MINVRKALLISQPFMLILDTGIWESFYQSQFALVKLDSQ